MTKEQEELGRPLPGTGVGAEHSAGVGHVLAAPFGTQEFYVAQLGVSSAGQLEKAFWPNRQRNRQKPLSGLSWHEATPLCRHFADSPLPGLLISGSDIARRPLPVGRLRGGARWRRELCRARWRAAPGKISGISANKQIRFSSRICVFPLPVKPAIHETSIVAIRGETPWQRRPNSFKERYGSSAGEYHATGHRALAGPGETGVRANGRDQPAPDGGAGCLVVAIGLAADLGPGFISEKPHELSERGEDWFGEP